MSRFCKVGIGDKTCTVACDFVLCNFPVSHLVNGFLISSQGLESRPCRAILQTGFPIVFKYMYLM